jgi:hypothetical protein
MSQYVFGTGQLFATPVGGGAPLRFGALQDVSVDFSGDIKELFGQYQFALDVARGKTKVEWKATTANIDANAFNQVFFDQTLTTGNQLTQVFNEAATVPATPGPYTVTATNGADFVMDLGVYFALSGLPLKQVAASPGPGEYTVSASGVYTFNAAQEGDAVLLNYLWEQASVGGSLAINNALMGQTPRFQLVLSQVYDAKQFTLVLYSCVAEKLTMPLKQDDYLMSELSGRAFANAANQVARLTTTSIQGGGA